MTEQEAIRILEKGFIEAYEELRDLQVHSGYQQEQIHCLKESMERQRAGFQKEIQDIFTQSESVISRLEGENEELRKDLSHSKDKLVQKDKLIKDLWLEKSNM